MDKRKIVEGTDGKYHVFCEGLVFKSFDTETDAINWIDNALGSE